MRVATELFDKIDGDGDGFVSSAESRAALLDRSYEGVEAAAVATFTRARHSSGSLARLSNDEWGPERRGISREDLAAIEGSAFETVLEEKFRLANASVQTYSTQLFTDSAMGAGIAQGSVGDCWLLAAAGAHAHVDPEAMAQRFELRPDGAYQVRLADGKSIEVAGPTQAECAAFGSSGAGGHWLSVLEKAVGKGAFSQELPQFNLSPRSTGAGIRTLTGDSVDHDFFRLTGLEKTRGKLMSHLESGDVVVAATGADFLPGVFGPGLEAQGLVPGHCYAVLDYDAESDTVQLQNPYGDTEWSGASDGKDDGVFRMPLQEMHRLFTDIAYQQR